MIEPGKYEAKAIDAEMCLTSADREQVAVQFELQDGAATITWYGSFSDAAFPYTVKALRAAGWTVTDPTELDELKPSSKTCELVIIHDEYQGKVSAKVNFVNEPGGGGVRNPMSSSAKVDFAKRMKARVLALEAGQQKAPAAPADFGDDDDIPF